MIFINGIIQRSTTRNILIGIVFIAIVNLVLFPLFADKKFDFRLILDLHFGFSLNEVKSILSALQKGGRKRYLLSTLLIDTPYAIMYGFVYSLLLARLIKKINIKFKPTIIIWPFLISFFDLIENTGISYFILSYPNLNERIVNIISLANQLKWISALGVFVVIMALLLYKFIIYYNRRK